jgi:hypothetical protein
VYLEVDVLGPCKYLELDFVSEVWGPDCGCACAPKMSEEFFRIDLAMDGWE